MRGRRENRANNDNKRHWILQEWLQCGQSSPQGMLWFMNRIRTRRILRVNKGEGEEGAFGSPDRERRASFGSVTRSHYASEHFLTRYPALIICLASAPETYGFIAKYARATKRGPEEKI